MYICSFLALFKHIYTRKLYIDSVGEGSATDTNSLDNIFASVKDLEVTPEMIREFLPKVNWDQLASMYVQGRSGAECEAR